MNISVIIPVYQQRPGVFRNALQSVFAQRLPRDCSLDVIVVDDGSPCPPEPELTEKPPDAIAIRVIKRTNGGPGAARNTGLDAVPDHADLIAFLDSDDMWTADHLQRAITTLGADADFYFSDQEISGLTAHATNFQALCQKSGAPEFRKSGLPKNIVAPGSSPPLIKPRQTEGSYSFVEREGLTALLKQFLPHLSTTVIRASQLGFIRFCCDLKHSGEDYLYFLMLANSARVLCYSTFVGVRRGRGVNMFHGALSWENPNSFGVVVDALRSFLFARALLNLDANQRELLERRIGYRRLEVVARCLSDLRRFRLPAMHVVLRADPFLVVLLPLLATQAVWRKACGKPIPDYLRAIESP